MTATPRQVTAPQHNVQQSLNLISNDKPEHAFLADQQLAAIYALANSQPSMAS